MFSLLPGTCIYIASGPSMIDTHMTRFCDYPFWLHMLQWYIRRRSPHLSATPGLTPTITYFRSWMRLFRCWVNAISTAMLHDGTCVTATLSLRRRQILTFLFQCRIRSFHCLTARVTRHHGQNVSRWQYYFSQLPDTWIAVICHLNEQFHRSTCR